MSEEVILEEHKDDPWPETTKGHPRGLMTLFFSEMWERFCYYGMRTLLTLFLVKSLMKGDAEASLIYGAYTGLVYAAPILGGRLADRFLGYRYAVMLGAVLMAMGEFFILGGTEHWLYIGMGALIIGNGYFKANISTIVGKLYKDNDPRRDSGFTIFYIGINVGALLATTVVAYVGETYGFDKGFGLAGIGMLLGLIIFWTGRNNYAAAAGLEFTEEGKKKILGPFNAIQVITVGSLLLIPLCYLLIVNNSWLNLIFLGLFIYVVYTLVTAGVKEDEAQGTSIWKDRMIALSIFMVINIVFWACFEQAGTSLTLFADRNVNREIMGWVMPASMTQFFNPFFIILFGSLFSVMWVKLSEKNRNPNIPMKFSLGILQLGLGFLLTYIGFQMAENNLVPLLVLVFLYMLHTTGELFLSPIGLSMVTKLSPKKMAGTAMGAWFLSFAIANLLGGQIAALTGSGHGGDDDKDKDKFTVKTTLEGATAMADLKGEYAEWPAFYEVPEDFKVDGKKVPGKTKNGIEIPKNITYGKYLDIVDWIDFRKGITGEQTFGAWLENRATNDTLKEAKVWLNKENWAQVRSDYKSIIESDLKAGEDKAGISIDDWSYFRGGISEKVEDKSLSLDKAYNIQKDIVQKARLEKYVDVFTKIGLVLLVISLLIALLSKPLKKLMHGVE
jgi:POT family proton-dependent oligopeptide transporter